jgi:hypothetical protein
MPKPFLCRVCESTDPVGFQSKKTLCRACKAAQRHKSISDKRKRAIDATPTFDIESVDQAREAVFSWREHHNCTSRAPPDDEFDVHYNLADVITALSAPDCLLFSLPPSDHVPGHGLDLNFASSHILAATIQHFKAINTRFHKLLPSDTRRSYYNVNNNQRMKKRKEEKEAKKAAELVAKQATQQASEEVTEEAAEQVAEA